jgi:MICOS complex subunit MIC19
LSRSIGHRPPAYHTRWSSRYNRAQRCATPHCPRHPGAQPNTDPATPKPKQTDASRAQLAELQVQARVASELRRLQQEEDQRLKELTDKLASAPGDESKQPSLTRHEVSKEVQALRAKLEQRKGVREVPEPVEAARGDVVRCLRENDRRPLDCWREVERFKEEVRRLEKGWVEKVIS